MKKTFLVIPVLFIAVNSAYAHEGCRHDIAEDMTAWREVIDQDDNESFDFSDEYCESQEQGVCEQVTVMQDPVQTYDQQVCDNTTSPAVSNSMAAIREFGINVLIKFLVIKDAIACYYMQAKEHVSSFLGLTTT